MSAARRGLARASASTLLAAAMLAGVAVAIILVPLLPGYDPYAQNLGAGYAEPFQSADGKYYLLGADALGRDLTSRLALAARVSLFIGLSAVAIIFPLGANATALR